MRAFLNLGTTTKQMTGFGALGVLLILMSAYAIRNMSAINDNVQNINDVQLIPITKLAEIKSTLLLIRMHSYSTLVFADDPARLTKQIDEMRELDQQLAQESEQFEATIVTPEVRKAFADFREHAREYKQSREERQLKPLLEGRKSDAFQAATATSKFPPAYEAINKCISLKTDIAKAKYDEANASYLSTRNTMFAASAVTVVLGLALGYGISLLIVKPLQRIMNVLESVAKGDLTKKADVKTTDELGRTAQALDTAIEEMKRASELNAEALVHGTALKHLMEATARAKTVEEATRAALDSIRTSFGYLYGSFWKVDPKENLLRFVVDSGSVGEEFRRAGMDGRFREGEGLNGRAWRQRDLIVVPDLSQLTDCSRASSAGRAGVKTAVSFPVEVNGRVVGTMDFFAAEIRNPSKERLDTLRNTAKIVSAAVDRVEHETETARIQSMMEQSPVSTMFADKSGIIRYGNAANLQMLRSLEKYLPVKADQVVGQSVDVFHKTPEKQRRIISDPANLPFKGQIAIGPEVLDFLVSPVLDQNQKFLGAMLTWEVVTARLTMEKNVKESAEREKQAADELRTKVDSILEVVSAAAQGDLTREAAVQGEGAIDQLADGLNQFLADLRSNMSTLAQNATSLGSSSEELSSVSQQMSGNAQETAAQAGVVSAASSQVSASVQTVATGIEEMGASIKEIAKNASEAARVATDAVRVAETTNATVSKLGESSAEIGQVIKVITSIAQQTNLLALNATIEAARAGEAGKGFAVVANEVKELAKETARATEEIGQKIEAIQTDTKGAVDAIGKIGGIIAKINDISSTIASAVEEQTATTNEIGRNVSEVAKSSADIAQNITSVATTAQSTTEGAGNTQQAAGELSRMASEMQQLVGKFRFDMESSTRPPVAPSRVGTRNPVSEKSKVSAGR